MDEKSIMEYDKQKEHSSKLGFDIQQLMDNKEFRLKMMNMMAEEWEKMNKKK